MHITETVNGIVMANAYCEKIACINLAAGAVKVEKLDVEPGERLVAGGCIPHRRDAEETGATASSR